MKLFFKDKGVFFTSLVTPLILLILYITFLGNVYKDTFLQIFQGTINISDKLINGLVGGQLFSSLLAVCCITVAFCSNMIMVQDKVTNAKGDISMTPVKNSTLALSYYIATFVNTLIVCLTAVICCLIYIAVIGWYLTFADILLILLDVFLLVTFGTALSSIINHFLTSQGQISAVGTIVSSCYGFVCGAYMPISSFPKALQKVISFLPGTYGTSLLRNHTMGSVINEIEQNGIPSIVTDVVRDTIDCNIYFFNQSVDVWKMYLILGSFAFGLVGIYVLMNVISRKRKIDKNV
jgi:multidrug/hemolysin transport system permease protein